MCGIVGVGSIRPIVDKTWLKSGRDSLTHRGPDDAGVWWSYDSCVGLAHRRLSIIDLSSGGHQPMLNNNKSHVIIFNGEIYNHCDLRVELTKLGYNFISKSDTEVLLTAYDAWGTDCLEHLNGQFAFGIYDLHKQIIFLARDRAGEKPLFYHISKGVLYFSSELKALLSNPLLPRKLDKASLDCYLSMGYIPGDRCILNGYNKLPPANAMCFDLKKGISKTWSYWGIPVSTFENTSSPIYEEELLDELEALLEDSIRLQMVADVPVGVLLSGGLDSSLITAMACRVSNKIKTFTIRFPGHGKLDETKHARMISKYFNTKHVELEATSITSDLIPMLARQFDEPIIDSSMIPTYLVSQLVRKYCTVALGGDGGDELFGGYNHYDRMVWMEKIFMNVPLNVRRMIAKTAEKYLPVGFKGRNYILGLKNDIKKQIPLIANYFDFSTRKNLMSSDMSWNSVAEDIYKKHTENHSTFIERAMRTDFKTYLAEDILVKVDRSSMLNSLEVRAPMLDYRLIEFAFGKVHTKLKVTANGKKILLKRLATRILPSKFDQQRKQGFAIPMAQWLKGGPFRDLFWEVLTDSQCIFDRQNVESILKGQDRGHNNGERLFGLVLLELWRSEYSVSC